MEIGDVITTDAVTFFCRMKTSNIVAQKLLVLRQHFQLRGGLFSQLLKVGFKNAINSPLLLFPYGIHLIESHLKAFRVIKQRRSKKCSTV